MAWTIFGVLRASQMRKVLLPRESRRPGVEFWYYIFPGIVPEILSLARIFVPCPASVLALSTSSSSVDIDRGRGWGRLQLEGWGGWGPGGVGGLGVQQEALSIEWAKVSGWEGRKSRNFVVSSHVATVSADWGWGTDWKTISGWW